MAAAQATPDVVIFYTLAKLEQVLESWMRPLMF